jgi:hypothetical protein
VASQESSGRLPTDYHAHNSLVCSINAFSFLVGNKYQPHPLEMRLTPLMTTHRAVFHETSVYTFSVYFQVSTPQADDDTVILHIRFTTFTYIEFKSFSEFFGRWFNLCVRAKPARVDAHSCLLSVKEHNCPLTLYGISTLFRRRSAHIAAASATRLRLALARIQTHIGVSPTPPEKNAHEYFTIRL